MTRPLCPAPRSRKVTDTQRFSRNAILIAITVVWLIGQGWTAYVHESRITRDGHRNAIANGCGSQSSPPEVQRSRFN
jgi:hypothetical protein